MLKAGSRLLTRALNARLISPVTVRSFTDPAPDQQPPPATPAGAEGSDVPRYIPDVLACMCREMTKRN